MPPRPPPALPSPPAIRVVIARDHTPEARATGGFVNLRRLELIAQYPDGTESQPFAYDLTTRASLDAVIFAAHFIERGVRHVYLRTAVRPPCAFRGLPPDHDATLWELPAGLIEPGEEPAAAAARETLEELGLTVDAAAMRPLGPWLFPAPALIGERHLFFHVEVDPSTRSTPTEDGSALERWASVIALPVGDALEHCRSGAIRDEKTELGLRRLAELP